MAKTDTKKISTTQLGKSLDLDSRKVFELLQQGKWIQRDDEDKKWSLTAKGKFEGGEYVQSSKFGTYIVWPQSALQHPLFSNLAEKTLTAPALGKALGLPGRQINSILAELGLINRYHKGWTLTDLGRVHGGREKENETSGIPFVVWSPAIVEYPNLTMVVKNLKGQDARDDHTRTGYVALDGHCLHSKAEMQIDNWLYSSGLVHACGRLLPVGESLFCDFYLPVSQIYIEYWGLQHDPKALSRKMKKLELYRQHELKLIELEEKDIDSLDEILPKQLLKFGVEVY